MTRILEVDPDNPAPAAIATAAAIIRAGGLVAFPTETVYGLGANALDPAAIARIYQAKGRPEYNPLIVHVHDAEAARTIVEEWPERAAALAAAFWPGPLTLVLRKRPIVPDSVTAGLATVGVRVPAHEVALALLRAADRPIAAPSANRSMALSPTAAEHVALSLGDRVDLLLDAGPASVGIESTVLDLTQPVPTILRPGVISAPRLEAVIGDVRTAGQTHTSDEARPSPGMMDRHYAPRATLVLTPGSELASAVRASRAGGTTPAVLVYSGVAFSPEVRVERMPHDAREYAHRLYAALHELDRADVDVVIVERVPEGPEWDGVRDRLRRAAHSSA